MGTTIAAVTTAKFENEVLKSSKTVIVDFWAEWCGPCKMLSPLLEEIAAEQGDKVKILKVNVDQEQQLAQKYNISSIPTLLFFKGGQVKEQIVGLQSKKFLVDKITSNG